MLDFLPDTHDLQAEVQEHRYWFESNLKQFPEAFQDKLKTLNFLVASLQLLKNKNEIEKAKRSIDDILNVFTFNGCTPIYLGVRNGYYIIPSAQMALSRLPIFMHIYQEKPSGDSLLPPLRANDFEELRNTAITYQFKPGLKPNSKPFIPQQIQTEVDHPMRSKNLYNDLKKSR